MKKQLLMGVACLLFLLPSFTNAQTLNQPANWPNGSWTLTGTFDAAALLSDPTTTANFSYDDDAAGSGSTDILEVASPAIDLTATAAAGDIAVNVIFDYNYNFGGSFDLEYFDADASSWVVWGAIADNGSTTSDWCGNIVAGFTSTDLDITGFSANQLLNFQYRLHYDASSVWGWGVCVASPTITSVPAPSTPPLCTTLTSPVDGSTDISIDGTLSFAASADATSYDVYLDVNAMPTTLLGNTTTTSIAYTGLLYSTTYYVQIVPKNLAGDAMGCIIESFETEADPAAMVTVICGTPSTESFCYDDNEDNTWLYTSSDGTSSLQITFTAGQMEGCCDDIIIYDGADATGTVLFQGNNGGDLTGLTFSSTGPNLFIAYDSDGSVNCQASGYTPTDWSVECLSCAPGAGTSAVGTCDAAAGLMIDVDVTNIGDGTIVIKNDGGVADVTVMATGVTAIGPFAFGSTVIVTLAHPTDATCDVVLAGLTLPGVCPPDNDDCAGAIAIAVGTGTCDGSTTNGDNTAAIDEGVLAATCFSGDNPDVWFSFVAPASGLVEISTDFAGGTSGDTEIALYSGACGALVEEDCDQDGGTIVNFNSIIPSATVVPGDTYYVRVSGWNGTEGSFCLQIRELCSLSIAVGNPSPCNPATNTYIVDVIATYAAAPATGTIDVNGTSFPITASPQTLSLELPADGMLVTISAEFSDDLDCAATEVDAFTAPADCAVNCTINAITVGTTGDCTWDGMTATFSQEITVEYSVPPGGGTLDVTVGTTLLSSPITTSPQVVTVTGIPADGSVLDVIAAFSADATCTDTSVGAVTAPEDSCIPPDCAASPVLACGETINTGDLSGDGAWNSDAVEPGACFSTPGNEFVFQFVATDAGDYTLDIALSSGTSSWNDYFYRTDEMCEETGWICLDDIATTATLTIPAVAAGATVYVLVDSETTGAGRIHDVTLGCPPPPIANAGGVTLCQNAAPELVDGSNAKVNLLVGGEIIAAINSNGQDLGMVDASYVRFDPMDNTTRDYFNAGAGGDGYDLIDRSIVITPTMQPTSPVSVFLYYTDDEYNEIIANADGDNASASWTDLGITKFPTDVCADMSDPQNLSGDIVTVLGTTAVTGGWEVEIEVSSFSGFQVHEGSTALPIKLDRFTAKADGRHNMIQWSTASEINVQDHTLMKSSDANNWDILDVVDGSANSTSTINYEMMDAFPHSITYYQLMTTDLDGTTSYSPIVSVARDADEVSAFLGASPVPTADVVNLNVYSQTDDNLTITLTDISGKRVMVSNKTITQGNHQLPLDLSNMTNGVYLVTITSDLISQTHRVIKN